jgi:AraC-like DNA-binding protein
MHRSMRTRARDRIRLAPPQAGVERLAAFFTGHGYDPHRHDTYAVGLTLHGVQSFGYRGTTLHSVAGRAVVLHPDETHDGRAGTDAGFAYRMAYIEPHLIQDALGEPHRPLPFVREAVTGDVRLIGAIAPALEDLDTPLDDLQRDQVVVAVAEALAALEGGGDRRPASKVRFRSVAAARAFLDTHAGQTVTSDQLEAVTGLTRFALTRQFRQCLGTSPYRYLIMRRLDRARRLILSGAELADAAAASGFADQSHMTRHFKKAYGVAPGHWRQIVALPR